MSGYARRQKEKAVRITSVNGADRRGNSTSAISGSELVGKAARLSPMTIGVFSTRKRWGDSKDMILLSFRLGILLALGCLGVGGFYLNQAFETSSQDVVVAVIVAPVLCALGLVFLWAAFSSRKTFREWERYRHEDQRERRVPQTTP